MRFSTLFALLPLVSSVVSAQHKSSARNVRKDAVLGIGIHFTISYSIATVRYESGKIEDLGLVHGGEEYIASMARLADPGCELKWYVCSICSTPCPRVRGKLTG